MQLIFTLVLAIAAAPATGELKPADVDPFGNTAVAPADVTLYVHVEDASQLRSELADRPIAEWVDGLLDASEASRVWSAIADDVNMTPGELFDLCFGSRATLLTRRAGDTTQWALLTHITPQRSDDLLNKLKVIVRGPRHNMAIVELPEHDLLLARSQRTPGMFIIGCRSHSLLFDEVLQRLDRQAESSLHTGKAITEARTLGTGMAGVYMKHDPPMGGWSVAVAHLSGDHLSVRHRAAFDSTPFTRAVTRMRIDPAPLAGFEDRSLMTIIEPSDIGGGRIDAFIRASFGEGLISGPMSRNVSDRRIIVVGEIEGRQEPNPIDLQATTLAVCVEMKNATAARSQLDRQMVNLARRLDHLGSGKFNITIPDEHAFRDGQPRTIDISPAARWITGSLPIAQPVTLNWTIVEAADDTWAVIATHPRQLEDSVKALRRDRCPKSRCEHVQSCGVASGIRIGQHLSSWSERSDLFAAPEQAEEFRASLGLMSRLAGGIETCRWKLSRPTANEMHLEVKIKLTAPQSARQE